MMIDISGLIKDPNHKTALVDNLRDLANQIEAVEAEPEAAKPWPRVGDEYFVINLWDLLIRVWVDDETDRACRNYGNVFRTEAEAEKVVAKRKAEAKIRRYIAENGLEFTPDWSDFKRRKVCIYYQHDEQEFESFWTVYIDYGSPFCFDTVEAAEQVIRDCEAELKILFDVAD